MHCDGKPITCYACGEAGHRANKYPKRRNRDAQSYQASHGASSAPVPNPERARHETFAQRPTTLAATGQRPAVVQRFDNQAKGKEVDIFSAAPRPLGRVYAMTQEQANTAPDVVEDVDLAYFLRTIAGAARFQSNGSSGTTSSATTVMWNTFEGDNDASGTPAPLERGCAAAGKSRERRQHS
ncbi:hypothetical protein Droror1_Dr00021632 [Drosera rotundifolia]